MAFKDSGDDDGKKAKKTRKSKGSRNGRGSLVLVLVVLWLVGLTAAVAFFNLPMGPGSADLEDRVAALERRSGQVRGTIPPPGVDDLGALTDRMNELERRLDGGGATAAGASDAAGDSGATGGDCPPCDQILDRLDRLESRVVAAGAGIGDGEASASAENGEDPSRSATDAESEDESDAESDAESDEAPKARSAASGVSRKSVRPGTRKPRPPRDIPGVEVRTFRRDGRPRAPVASSAPRAERRSTPAAPSSPPAYSRDGNLDENLRQSTQTESVYEITRRMAPMYGYTEGEMRRVERLAPGAAIYPGNNGGYVGSVLGN
ncbi:MAG: hypothetical protein ACLFRG_04165 [Desulfococcaceae bacterium]